MDEGEDEGIYISYGMAGELDAGVCGDGRPDGLQRAEFDVATRTMTS